MSCQHAKSGENKAGKGTFWYTESVENCMQTVKKQDSVCHPSIYCIYY
ncbi:hypothetical protein HMPREF0083_03456 [Aneurinibacillus aneurinilyticus ATCC 12856]|uniref:Uncharacterized protein n=1 Tax=Aneurinibacillus aneurinilyticus ATCC 12856 TaxID=649747 RepID=U1X0G0_ANEAE|nr:hypothetical protein HMPREF0083_03456 [Aneurinibacillus aneurinilyticus ATCC 12856]